MLKCWQESPTQRPTFEELVKEFDAMLVSLSDKVDSTRQLEEVLVGLLVTKSAQIVRQKIFEAEFQSESRLSARQELPAFIPSVYALNSPSLSQFNNLNSV